MIQVTLNNINNLNASLQVGDLVYSATLTTQDNSNDAQSVQNNIGGQGVSDIVGILRQITINGNTVVLDIDETVFFSSSSPAPGSFLMFSKYDQVRGDVIGYYAKAKFKNNSREKAELFSVGSEVVINSK